MSQPVESDSFQTHMIWPHFYKDSRSRYIPSSSFAKFQFPASKSVRAKASLQNGFPAEHFQGEAKSITPILSITVQSFSVSQVHRIQEERKTNK